ncbi:MAG: hypothetical protein JNG90_12020 [Planctomycetaceae bacterium]|nr:hypothetical protein [Planctomycetaceae bacterium]
MSSELSPDRDAVVNKLVEFGHFSDRRQALDHAVDLLQEEAATLSELREGLASLERGEGTPLRVAVRSLREELGVPEDA